MRRQTHGPLYDGDWEESAGKVGADPNDAAAVYLDPKHPSSARYECERNGCPASQDSVRRGSLPNSRASGCGYYPDSTLRTSVDRR